MKINLVKTLRMVKSAATMLDIPLEEAKKASVIDNKNIKVIEKVTFKNFYKNPSFWSVLSVAIVSGVSGDYFEAASNIIGLFI